MPMNFWAHAFISAAYLVNRLPTLVLDGKSPFESSVPVVLPVQACSRFGFPSVTISSPQQDPGSALQFASSRPAPLPLESTRPRVQPDVNSSPGAPPVLIDHHPPISSNVNAHPMITRSKNGIFKPRVFFAELSETEPTSIEETIASKEWALAAQ
ncbi:Retrovirus-related Pol polyprotein from transposon TNT 1-94 [Gossypium australe]|uniref:Retrovirus-related Pol polyprotein from transposon TNT 1-94 n=1 Tax=Gossypium australe TaxID=47621 RepID=A0A5B6WIJ6_9ROSI|nr:Retrovirus-related Pol polyprotein from transposon TNT 1-94 [Gossypium australe]